MVESASGIGLTRRLGEEEYCKDRAQDGAILAVPVRMADRRECSDRKIVSPCRDQARLAYNGVVFEVKKEIPIKMAIYCITNATNGVTKQGEGVGFAWLQNINRGTS